MKNASTADNSKAAGASSNELLTDIAKVETNTMTTDQHKTYDDVIYDVKEQAEYISENAGNIEHQREHFQMLSKNIEDLVKTLGGGRD